MQLMQLPIVWAIAYACCNTRKGSFNLLGSYSTDSPLSIARQDTEVPFPNKDTFRFVRKACANERFQCKGLGRSHRYSCINHRTSSTRNTLSSQGLCQVWHENPLLINMKCSLILF